MVQAHSLAVILDLVVYVVAFAGLGRLLRLKGPWLRAGGEVRRPTLRRFGVHLGALGAVYGACAAMFLVVATQERHRGSTEVKVAEGMPAAAAGLREGDRLVSVDGVQIEEFTDLVGVIQEASGALRVEVERDGERATFEITPADGRIGVMPLRLDRYAPTVGEALSVAVTMPLQVIGGIPGVISKLVSGRIEEERLGGPVAMWTTSDQLPRRQWVAATAVICSHALVAIALLAAVLAWRGAVERRAPFE